ncbi:MAG: hypothetical protein ACRDHN_13910 [Thermomicrobiales bacterium]
MKIVYYLTWIMAFVFVAGETARRGLGYFAINATTMLEDYLCAALLLWAAFSWFRKQKISQTLMAAAWGYAAGGMFVPFFAHLESWLRGATFRPDHPHEDLGSIVVKGVIWAICLGCLIVTLRNFDTKKLET